MKYFNKITFYLIVLCTIVSPTAIAQGSVPPPPIPPPPPGTPINDWIPYAIGVALLYGSYKVLKKRESKA